MLDPIEIDPILLQDDLQERMRRYLLTALPIHRRFPKLREQASRELSKSAALIQGPFLEALPDFPKGKSLKKLVEEGLLHPGFAQLDLDVYTRALHKHQVEAISRVIQKQENIVVSTGTGSGKTECFFFPMLDCLLKAGIKGKPGIRAILVYPLNALANDQLYQRLVPVLAHQLKDYGLTVGRYTGQTTIGRERRWFEEQYLADTRFKKMFGNEIPKNWLLSRTEMLESPPHVLVTNYAMLEHLLLLPKNADLFQHADLRFLVLDELHTYLGAQATEVSLLLRKLRNRYAPSSNVRCIGTSASLGDSPEAKKNVIEFASRLFGYKFSEPPVTSQREAHRLLRQAGKTVQFTPKEWIGLHNILREVRHLDEAHQISEWNRLVDNAGLSLKVTEEEGKTLSQLLCAPLSQERTVKNLSDHLSKTKLDSLANAAEHLFQSAETSEEAQNALKSLVALGAFARENQNTFPLLPARYHLFTRGIEEATVQLAHSGDSEEHAVNLRFKREFKDHNTDLPRYRLMTCRKCGELYFEGFEKGQHVSPEQRGKGWKRSVFWLKPKDVFVIPEDSTEEEAEQRNAPIPIFLHLENGQVKDMLDERDDPREWLETHRARMDTPRPQDLDMNPDAKPKVTICQSCGSQDRFEIITPFHPGDQALSTAISEVLYAHLPTSKKEALRSSAPGRGRNMLVFSDNRQDAAFFAPYLQRSHEDLLIRRAIVKQLKKDGGITTLMRLSNDLDSDITLRTGLTDRDGKKAGRNNRIDIIRGKVFSEFCSPGGSRTSLEDLGVAEVNYEGIDLDQIAEEASVPKEYGGNLIRWILDSVRLNRAISIPSGTWAADDFIWGAYAQDDRRYSLEIQDKGARFRLLPSRRSDGEVYLNRYVDVLRDCLKLENWEELLRKVWETLIRDLDGDGEILISDPEGSPLRVLDHRLIAAKLRTKDQPVYRCDKCSKISSYTLGGICTQWRCNGKVEEVDSGSWTGAMDSNHYYFLYTKLEDLPSLMVKEHTAAIASHVREEIEKNFKDGRINILSSSTTMEMGIDLGDLEGVMLRNVPPEISNYQQRAGRAGRRAQAAPVSITYARNRRYDQDVFDNAETFLEKEPRTPFVHLANARLFQRHQFSVLISKFLETEGLHETGLQIGQLFGLPKFNVDRQNGGLTPQDNLPVSFTEIDEDKFNRKIADWMNGEDAGKAKVLAEKLLVTLRGDLNDEEFEALKRTSETMDKAFLEAVCRLANTFGQRFRHYIDRAEQLKKVNKLEQAAREQNRGYRWANQPIVNFLSKYGLIPTYSFPVDNIDLEVLQGKGWGKQEIELSRDARLGVVEYAPGAEVVAGGRVWTSRAIPYTPREFMPPFYYKICENCRNIESWEDASLIPSNCSSCEAELKGTPRTYLEPTGFTTAIGEGKGKEPGSTRELPPRAMETQLIGNAPEKLFRGTDLLKVEWASQHAQNGRMVVINKGNGEGFVKCGCGYSHAVTPRKRCVEPHKNPYTDEKCDYKPSYWKFDLAHTFHTDVLQIRGNLTVPYPDTPEGENQHQDERNAAREGVARSIAEAIRLASCELVSIPEGEMSSTFRWLPQGGLELVLYDNVPGGAGYTSKVIEYQASELVRYAIENVLTCSAECSSSCSKCLRSFSNQAHWEVFRRKEAMHWLKRILEVKREDPEKLGGNQIKPTALKELCESADHIGVIRESLANFTGGIESDDTGKEVPISLYYPEWEKLHTWMATGKKVTSICRKIPDFKDANLPRARRLAESFLPLVREGKLEIRNSPPHSEKDKPKPQLILFSSKDPDATLIYELEGKGAVLEQLWSTDNTLIAKQVPKKEAEDLLSVGQAISINSFEEPERIKRFYYRSGEQRNFARDFQFLSSGPVKTFELTDRYMVGMEWSAKYLRDFLAQVGDLMSTPPQMVVLRYGPEKSVDDRYYWKSRIDGVVAELKTLEMFKGTEFHPFLRAYSQTVSNFHDRRISVRFGAPQLTDTGKKELTKAQAPSKRRRRRNGSQMQDRTVFVELTGGVSILMDRKHETTVYVFEDK